MERRHISEDEVYVPKTDVPPHAGHIAAAKLIMKRHREGKSRLEITPKIRYLANYDS
ncbi:RNA helicase [Corynebacterium gottingense]|uniref:RNA helicase n=1 Tax=Corynebacterium TaxID=1716 RepID=UPI000BAA7CAD|nr:MULTISPECIES: RNA helicase [Corynebacterium]PAT12963.1 RNA helicase [Corynebacterium hadale]